MIILNSLKAASDLLDQRASIYSDRPRLIVAREIFCGGLFIALMPYGDLLVFIFILKSAGLTFSLAVGVALAAPHMKCSQKS
jgi:hypothetical protein